MSDGETAAIGRFLQTTSLIIQIGVAVVGVALLTELLFGVILGV